MADVSPILHQGRNIAFDPAAADAARAEADAADAAANAVGEAAADTPSTQLAFVPLTLAWNNVTFDVPRKKEAGRAGKKKPAADDENLASKETTGEEAPAAVEEAFDTDTPVMNAIPGAEDGPKTRVLHECSGLVKPGEMLAVLGSSGAGKSTLLNLLAGRIKSSKDCVSGGEVLVNGAKRDFATYRKQAAYVEQDDQMFATLTVAEQIRYAALMRLPKTMSRERKLQKVEAIIQELGLSKCRDTIIGNELVKGVSGGERKRTSIGIELVTDPSLLICDEPTTGLDSFSALNVITTLRHLASTGRTVVATIHQPRSSIFAQFDKLLVLSEGRSVYFGPASEASSYFSSIGFQSPPLFNIADYVIDAVSIDYRSKQLEARTKKRVLYLAKEHSAKHDSSSRVAEEDGHGTSSSSDMTKAKVAPKQYFQNSWVGEFAILFRRGAVKLMRDKLTLSTRLGQTIVFAILLGVIWVNTGRDDPDLVTLRSVQGVVFFLAINQAFDGAFSVIFDFPLERAVLTRERSAGSYRISSYWVAALALDVAKTTILNAISVTVVYWMVGLRKNIGAYAFALLTTVILSQIGEAYSQVISVLTADPQIVSALVPLALVMAFLFAGFFILPKAMPDIVAWGRFLSFLYWGYQAVGHNEFSERSEKGPLVELILEDFNSFSRWGNLGVLVGFLVFFKGLYFVVLVWKRPKFDTRL